MENILYLIAVYLGYLLVWGVICLVVFAVSLIFKRPTIIGMLTAMSTIVVYILNFFLGLGLLLYLGALLVNGQFLWFIIMLFLGIYIIGWLLNLLQMPFLIIPVYFAQKAESIEKQPDVVRAEVLDKQHKVIFVTESEKEIDKRFAIYFIAVYILNFLSLLINRRDYPSYLWGDYIFMPFFWIISQVLFFGLIIGAYNKIKNGRFFYPRKKNFFILTFKVTAIVLVVLTVLFVLTGFWQIW